MSRQLYLDVCSGSQDACTLTAEQLCGLRDCVSAKEWGVLAALLSTCGSGGGGGAVTEANVAPTLTSSTGVSSTTAGVFEVSIANVGASDGTVAGTTLPVGASVTYRGYYDAFASEMKRIGSVSYDATGTEFIISTVP